MQEKRVVGISGIVQKGRIFPGISRIASCVYLEHNEDCENRADESKQHRKDYHKSQGPANNH